MESTRVRGIVIALIASDAASLWFGRPRVAVLAVNVAHPHRWVAASGADGAAATLAQTGLWLCAVWVGLAVLSVAASRLPGAAGQLASAVARRAVPAVIRGSIAGALGASIFLAPLAAGAATPDHAAVPAATSVSVLTPAASFDAGSWAWPTSPPASTSPPGSTSPHTDGDPVPIPVPWPHDAAKPTPSTGVVVYRGDSLWAIAAHRLGPRADPHEIATATKQWFEANKPTIGSDPSLIHPGQHLHEPTEKGQS